MNKSFTVKQIAMAALGVVLVLLLLGANWHNFLPKPPSGPTIPSGPPKLDPNKIPLTGREIVNAGGYWALSPLQREWVFNTYRDSLLRVRRAVQRRLSYSVATIPDFKAGPHYEEMNVAIGLLNQAIDELESAGPDGADPLVHQQLLDDCVRALHKR